MSLKSNGWQLDCMTYLAYAAEIVKLLLVKSKALLVDSFLQTRHGYLKIN